MRWKQGSTDAVRFCVVSVCQRSRRLPSLLLGTGRGWCAGSAIALGDRGECVMQVSETACSHTWRPASRCPVLNDPCQVCTVPMVACRYQEMVQQRESSDRYLDNEAQTLPGLSKTKETQSNTLSTVSTAVQVTPHASFVHCWQPGLAAGQGCEQPSGCPQLQQPPPAASPAAIGNSAGARQLQGVARQLTGVAAAARA